MKTLIISLMLTCLITGNSMGQNALFNVADSLAGYFVKSIHDNDREKVILQTDRKIYAAGEKIWFKAFLLHAIDNRLDTASKNLFVDLVNDSDKVISQLVLNAATLQTSGAIQLNEFLSTGYYWLRCYTKVMLQNDSLSIWVQPVYIKNLGNSSTQNMEVGEGVKQTALPGRTVINFFPEGGAVISGINSTGALQVSDDAGNPLMVQGVVTDAADSVVSTFSTNRMGLARINFFPVWFKKYFAVIHLPGQDVKYPLPGWNPFAAQLSVIHQGNEYIQAYVTLEDSIYSRKFSTFVLGISRDSVCFAGIGRGMYQVDIPVANFPGGIATLLLFDANEHLLSERKVFINKDNYKISISPDKPDYAARDKAHVAFAVTDADGKPLVASLNVSIQDTRIMQMSDEIKSDTIEPVSPDHIDDWLKHNKNTFSDADIDLLMLAQKPSFNKWRLPPLREFHADSTSLLLNLAGKVVNRRLQPLKQKIVTAISLTGTNPYIGLDTTNDRGGFALPLPAGRGDLLLKLEVKNKHDINESDSIEINNFVFPHFKTPASLKHIFTTGKQLFLKGMAKYHIDTVFVGVGKEWLKPVTVRAATRPKSEVDYDASKRLSSFSYILSGDKLGHGSYGEIAAAVLTVPGMALKGGKLVLYGGNSMGGSDDTEPVVIIDGVMLDANVLGQSLYPPGSGVLKFLSTLDARSVDFIEILKGPDAAIYGINGGAGVIVINTKTRPKELVRDVSPFKIVQPVTYHVQPKFVMPDYMVKQVKNSKSPDPRTTIYWNSDVITGLDGKASVDFYTADEATTYTVTVSGLTANGEYIYKRTIIKRK
ncbi:MAG TPA: TonB-dependent receptor plug domain-containing protein [Chitinophagaceae bacterium]|nr:TonB-dependent receptor plug domain-containing protein [Chitinophagaceae bacterium]